MTMKTMISLLAITCLLLGCSAKSPVEFATEAKESGVPLGTDQTAIDGCRQWLDDAREQELQRFDSLPAEEKTFALMHHDTMEMIKNVWGKEQCRPGTNIWDAYQVFVVEREKTNRQISSDTASTVKLGIGVEGGVRLVDSLAGKLGDRIAGDKIVGGRDAMKADRDVTITGNTQEIREESVIQVAKKGNNTATSDASAEEETPVEETAQAPTSEGE